mgnify:CR=1 FL=1
MKDYLKSLDYEEAIPTSSLIESIRSFGYNLNTAVADIVDNSITANAKSITIHLEWNAGDPFVAILDEIGRASCRERV